MTSPIVVLKRRGSNLEKGSLLCWREPAKAGLLFSAKTHCLWYKIKELSWEDLADRENAIDPHVIVTIGDDTKRNNPVANLVTYSVDQAQANNETFRGEYFCEWRPARHLHSNCAIIVCNLETGILSTLDVSVEIHFKQMLK
jgi:hypothetical protein